MSPSKFYDAKKEINGARPSPLKINKHSHLVQQQRHPVIIYTHSPRVIHTKPRDFMALVQKLTGLSRSDDEAAARVSCSEKKVGGVHDDNSSSSVTTDENCGGGGGGGGGGITDLHGNSSFDPYLSDVPLFTPSSSDFFCSSSRPYYHLFSSPNMAGSAISHPVLEVIKAYPDYYCN